MDTTKALEEQVGFPEVTSGPALWKAGVAATVERPPGVRANNSTFLMQGLVRRIPPGSTFSLLLEIIGSSSISTARRVKQT